ncbi:hypothetical protein CALVIDRAFT_563834 [Calocera viscosa TUFC12733]|uniref:N-acetyltransferase domain-containing protein n=1 Tax=Calocera viscosa (strain TUFC12733) TaxID=1330018 RepID=A0A167M4X3_CALVF|nr:hypothetical protein CALVIDRAFT_563834 [Calocera viscosa TUFC12733]
MASTSHCQPILFDTSRDEPYIPLPPPYENLRLTPFRIIDVEAVVSILNQPAVYSHLLTPFPFTKEHAEDFIGEQRRRYEADRQYFTGDAARPIQDGKVFDYGPMLVIREVRSDGLQVFLGVAGIWRSPFLYEAGEQRREECKRDNDAMPAGDPRIIYSVAYYLDPSFHSKGVMTAAVRELIRSWAIPHMSVRDIRVGIIENNLGSQRVLEKVGFQLTGKVEGVTPMQGKRELVLGQWLMRYAVE